MNILLSKLLSGVGIVSVIFVFGFYSGYKVKSNAINAYNAQEQVKLASLQARYDNVSAVARNDYLIAFNEVINQYESSNINNTTNQHDKLWYLFHSKHIASEISQNKSTCRVDETTTTRLKNGKLNTIQLLFLQSYIKQIQELQ